MSARRLFLPAAPLVMMFAALSACGGGPDPMATGDAHVVSIGISEPKRLIPSTATESEGAAVLNALFTPLVEYDDDYEPFEVAAESITTSDNQVWTIRLRPGWRFHNGEPVTADSYINAWNAGAYGPNAHDGNYFFEKIVGYRDLNPTSAREAPTARKLSGLVEKDDLTIEVTLAAPYVNFKSMLGYTAFLPLPQVAFADVAANTFHPAYEQAPIGQGPFRMKGTWQHDQQIETERNPGYAGPDPPKVAGILFKIYQQQTTQYQDLLAGQLDVVPEIAPENIASAPADLGDRFQQTPASTIQTLAFPTFDPRFSKVEIRRAISMAIDREEITRVIFRDAQRPLRAFVSPLVPGYREGICGEACEFNPQKARQLFEAAGGAKAIGGRLEIAYNIDGGHKPWVDATCNQLRTNLGVECVGNPQPKFAELLTKAERKEPMGMFRMGWVFDYPAIENYLGPLYSTHGSSNYYGYSNAQFDRLLAAGDRAANPDDALKLYQQAEDLLVRDLPVIPLRYMLNSSGHSTRVANVHVDVFRRVKVLDLTPAP
jgi:peptide/nickel transport system substrate-binding protein/oligopeptide transport system substrate-binding protein